MRSIFYHKASAAGTSYGAPLYSGTPYRGEGASFGDSLPAADHGHGRGSSIHPFDSFQADRDVRRAISMLAVSSLFIIAFLYLLACAV
ncbi:MAG: hypothetical protein ILP18_11935 [Treponema sp.]|nr:hypothetical protein [Treponema sp.]